MSALLKSGSSAARAAVAKIALRTSPENALIEALTTKVEELENSLTKKSAEMEQLKGEIEAAFERGRSEGLTRGQQKAESQECERLALLQENIAAAREEHANALESTERLAALLARDVLDLLFSEPEYRAGWVSAILNTQLQRIDRQSVIEVRVSAEDFEEITINDLFATMDMEDLAIVRDPKLPAGGCVIRQRLGEIDVGLQTQWGSISNLLETMAAVAETVQ